MAARVAFALHRRVATEIAQVEEAGGIPSPAREPHAWHSVWQHDVFHSTGLEGGLSAREVDAVLRDHTALGGHRLATYLATLGYAAAARTVYAELRTPGPTTPVNARAIGALWELARAPLERLPHFGEPADADRDAAPDVGALRHELSNAHRVTARLPVCVRAAAVEAAVHRAWPDRPGRVLLGRLSANLALVRHGYPPAIVPRRDKDRHASALRLTHADLEQLSVLIARGVLDTLQRFPVPSLSGRLHLVAISALDTHDVSADALRVAALRGRLRAQRGDDGVWRSSQRWVDEYLANRYRRPGKTGAGNRSAVVSRGGALPRRARPAT